MSQEKRNSDRESLVEYARELILEREGSKELRVVRVLEDQVPSNELRILRVEMQDIHQPNESYSVILDENRNEVVDLENLSKAEGVSFFSSHININRELLNPAPAVEPRTFNIDPSENHLTLNFGEVLEETLTVTIGAGGLQPKLDLYFLADTTGSMGSVLEDVQAAINLVIDQLETTGIDVVYGVGNYRDFPAAPADVFIHQLSLTTDLVQVRAQVATWNASGGRDLPEAQLYALDQLAEPPLGTIGWRTDSKRMIIWFGDEPGHEPICKEISGLTYDIDLILVLRRLAVENITIIAVDTKTGREGLNGDPQMNVTDYQAVCAEVSGNPGQATDLARFTRGSFIDGVDSTQIVNNILEQIENIVPVIPDVTLDPSGNAARFVSRIQPTRQGPFTGTEGRSLDFHVTFRGNVECRDDRDAIYSGQIAVKVGNDVVTVKELVVTVPKCKPTIIGEPSAVVYQSNTMYNGDRLHVYARSDNEHLFECFWDPPAGEWIWVERRLPAANRQIEAVFAAEQERESNRVNNTIHVFVLLRNPSGNLEFRRFFGNPDDNIWTWQRIPLNPQVTTGLADIGAVAIRQRGIPTEDEDARLFPIADTVFALMLGTNNNLYSYAFGFSHQNGFERNHGRPSGVALKALRSRSGKYDLSGPDFFVIGHDNNLYVQAAIQRWTPLRWSWHNLGKPSGITQITKGPAVASLRNSGYWTFVIDNQNRLLVNRWNGNLNRNAGSWDVIGRPSAARGFQISHQIEAIIFPAEYGSRHLLQVYVFLVIDGELWSCHGNGAVGNWNWRNLGSPPQVNVISTPFPVAYKEPRRAIELLYCFVRGDDDHLWVCVWDGVNQPNWRDLSMIGRAP